MARYVRFTRRPLARGPREKRIKELLVPLEKAMGGKVELDDSGRFYLNISGVSMEMHLVAEGLRKLAMIARLIATGSLVDKGFLFWDEPESNLNPKTIKVIARTILHLCQSGIQVFVASHSLFLIRELDILLQTAEFKGTQARFFGLHREAMTALMYSRVARLTTSARSTPYRRSSASRTATWKRRPSNAGDHRGPVDIQLSRRLARRQSSIEWSFYRNQFQQVCGGAKAVDILAIEPRDLLMDDRGQGLSPT